MVDWPDIVHVKLAEEFTGQFQTSEGIVENIPLVRIPQPHWIGAEKDSCRHPPGPVEREGIHGIEHTVLDGIEELELAHDVLRAEWLECQFAAGLLNDAVAPRLEDIEANTAWPGCLDFPCGGLACFRVSDIGSTEQGGAACCRGCGFEKLAPAVIDAFLRFITLCGHGFSPLVF